MQRTDGPWVRVVAGLVARNERFLVTRRGPDAARANQWEFPGGKLEPGETGYQALVREFREELSLEVLSARPLFSCLHNYPDCKVELHLWQVTDFRGEARGLEGQELRWVSPTDLRSLDFLKGNRSLLGRICELVNS